jgi:hypothetical protein
MQMTLRYAHLAPERMRDAVDVLEAGSNTERKENGKVLER